MADFEHFVLTKFNVVRDQNRFDKAGIPVRTIEWLDHRFDLFERFCLPSVRAQTNCDFTWLIGFDEQVPEPHVRRLRAHEAAFRNLVLVPARRAFRNCIPEHVVRRTEWLLTTRLDNDDALHRRAVEILQASCRDLRELTFLNLRYGYCYAYPEGGAIRVEDRSNNFISLFERRTDQLRTAVSVTHSRAASVAPIRQIGDEPLWLQVVHSRNIANKMPGGDSEPVDLTQFGLTPE